MILLDFLLFAVLCSSVAKASPLPSNQAGENSLMLTTPQLANEWGYTTENHDVVTEDGYILSIFRVKRKDESVPAGAKVLLLFGGLIAPSDHYFLMTEKPLLLDLVDDGYDVWLGNVRGTRYGKRHKILSATDVDFWDFSNHELGFYDAPATIDYVLNRTQNVKLGYVGYSQGSTIFFIMMSEKPEYNNKVAVMLAIAPAVYFNHNHNIALRILAPYASVLLDLVIRMRFFDVLSLEGFTVDSIKKICTDPELFPIICRPFVWEFFGPTTNGQNDDSIRRTLLYTSSSGVKTSMHYAQAYTSGKFRQYKYDTEEENLRKYGSLEPPEYNLKNARVPIAVVAAEDDRLAEYEDVKMLVEQLPNVFYFEKFPSLYYGHLSMQAATNASKYLYKTFRPYLTKVLFQ